MLDQTPSEDLLAARQVLAGLAGNRAGTGDLPDDLILATGLGIDSLQFIRLILEVEEKLKRHIFHVGNIGSIRTVGDLMRVVENSRM
jgi:acyl carrier protein